MDFCRDFLSCPPSLSLSISLFPFLFFRASYLLNVWGGNRDGKKRILSFERPHFSQVYKLRFHGLGSSLRFRGKFKSPTDTGYLKGSHESVCCHVLCLHDLHPLRCCTLSVFPICIYIFVYLRRCGGALDLSASSLS